MRVRSEAVDGQVRVVVNDNQVAQWIGDDLKASGELSACTAILPALISEDVVIRVEGGLTGTLFGNLDTLQDVFCRWMPDASRVEVVADQRACATGRRTTAFFSGGVDSFHAVLKHREEIDQLVYVEGFDIPADKPRLRQQVRETLSETAETLDLPLKILETDLRLWSDKHVNWEMYHGAALASAAHLLRGEIERAIIPSTYSYDELFPWGSHPLTDPLWSGAIDIIHSGSEATRPQKIAAISDEATARRALRVCWKNPDEAYNCGRCEKCLRTMTSLAAIGVLEAFVTFPDTLTVENVSRLELNSASAIRFAKTNVKMLDQSRVRPDLQAAWNRALQGSPLRMRQRAQRQLGRAKRYVSRRVRG